MKKVENPVTVISFNFHRSRVGFTKAECILLRQEMGQHDKKADGRADRCRKSGTERTHITRKHEEIVPENIENSAGKHGSGSKGRILVIPQIGRQHLVKQKTWNSRFNRAHIFSCKCQRIILRSECN